MAKKEIMTDLWVYDMLKEIGMQNDFSAQGSNIKEIDEALATASKKGTGNVGFPEYVGVINDFLVVIEDKASLNKHLNRDENDLIAEDVKSVTDYAVNGALFYGKHLAKNTTYKKIIAIGVSGNEKNHRISPIFVDERGGYKELDDVETFISFSADNINEYYEREILEVKTNDELKTEELLKVARSLHEDLRNYGNLEDKNKPLIVSGILLALSEIEHKNFDISDLIGDKIRTDGSKIYKAIEDNLKRANVSPEVKRDKLLNQFNIIKDNNKINEKNSNLGKTPLRYFTEVLYNSIFTNIKYSSSTEDYIGRFYGEFMSYSGGDGQSLGIILTPRHITDLFCELLDVKPTDKVLDPCCGADGLLIKSLLNNDLMRESFFQKVDDVYVFDKLKFIWLLDSKEFLPDSYTLYKNMIGLVDNQNNLISQKQDVSLVWPYKDCVLEGGQTKEDQKRDEIFYNETLAPDEVNRLLAPKALGNSARYSIEGVETGVVFDEDDNLIIKGNNLMALSSILEKYSNKAKLIYIDIILQRLIQFNYSEKCCA